MLAKASFSERNKVAYGNFKEVKLNYMKNCFLSQWKEMFFGNAEGQIFIVFEAIFGRKSHFRA